jgi:hypothetical protein
MILTRSKQAIKEKVDEPSKVVEGVPVKSKPVAATPANFGNQIFFSFYDHFAHTK